jgi:hypothetical protein
MSLRENRNVASAEEIASQIELIMTADFFKKLMAYSIKRFSLKFGIKYDIDRGYNGQKVEDIISSLMLSFLDDGGRNWYKDQHPEFIDQLYSSLDSEIYNVIKKNSREIASSALDETAHFIDVNDMEYQELFSFCLKHLEELGADIDELLVFECISKGLKRGKIAEELDIPPDKITQIKKRLDRKIILLKNKLAA